MTVGTTRAVPVSHRLGMALAVGLTGLLAACGGQSDDNAGGDGGDEQVASLATTAAPATSGPAERPLIRPDTSEAEEERMWDGWRRCMKENGIPERPSGKGGARSAREEEIRNNERAEKHCGHKHPEELWQRAQRIDPQYADKLRDWVTCIRSHGIDAWEEDGFLAFKSLPPEDQMRHVDECEGKVFGGS